MSGCDKSSDDDSADEDDSKDKKEAEAEEPAPTATASAKSESTVETYPDMVKQSGTYRLLRNFTVFRAADGASERITGLARGTLINAKATHRGFLLVDWPSGPGELSPGWIRARINSSRFTRVEKPPESLPVASTVPVTSASAVTSAAPEASAATSAAPEASAATSAAPEASAAATAAPEASATAVATAEPTAAPTAVPTAAPAATTVKKPFMRFKPSIQLKKAK